MNNSCVCVYVCICVCACVYTQSSRPKLTLRGNFYQTNESAGSSVKCSGRKALSLSVSVRQWPLASFLCHLPSSLLSLSLSLSFLPSVLRAELWIMAQSAVDVNRSGICLPWSLPLPPHETNISEVTDGARHKYEGLSPLEEVCLSRDCTPFPHWARRKKKKKKTFSRL